MTLMPLLVAAPAIRLHAFAAMIAFAFGLVQFAAPKGTLAHRTLGWIWVTLMLVVSVSAFFIHRLRFTLVMLPLAVIAARHHAVPSHRRGMIAIFVGGLVIAGLFTFVPGRIMHAVAFGQ